MKLLPLISLLALPLFAVETSSLRLALRSNLSIRLPGVTRVAVGNTKIVKVKSIPPSILLLTGVGQGKTTVRAWNSHGKEFEYLVSVISQQMESDLRSSERGAVVKVSLEFLELNFSFGKILGIEWPDSLQFGGISQLTGSMMSTGLNYEATFGTAKGWIRHLQKEGWAKILASPELYVRLGEEAVFHSGGELPIAVASQSFGNVLRKIEWKKFGITAKVRPQSVDQVHMSGDINLEVSEPDLTNAIDNIPALARRNLTTKINSLDGETVILSGLVKRETSHEKTSVPILGSIPLLGALFSSNANRDKETELIMTVTFSMSTHSRENENLKKFKKKYQSTGG